jgi:hypothetical protein
MWAIVDCDEALLHYFPELNTAQRHDVLLNLISQYVNRSEKLSRQCGLPPI